MIQVEKLVAFQVARRLSPNKICIRAEASLPKAGSGASFRVASCKKPSQTISESVMGFFFGIPEVSQLTFLSKPKEYSTRFFVPNPKALKIAIHF